MIVFSIRVGETYRSQGFFNVSVDFQRYLTMTDGPVDIFIGDEAKPIVGRISRSANTNATPRVFGKRALADFFQQNFQKGDLASVEVLTPLAIRIRGRVGQAVSSRQLHRGAPGTSDTRIVVGATSPPRKAAASPPESQVHIHDLYGHLTRFCEQLWRRHEKAVPADLASLIGSLQRQKLVPTVEAGMMHTVRTVRNSHVHEHRRLGPEENRAIMAAWDVITHWAEREHASLWESTADFRDCDTLARVNWRTLELADAPP